MAVSHDLPVTWPQGWDATPLDLQHVAVGLAGCPAENVNPYKEPILTELPRCILSCPDPAVLPEGYKEEMTFSARAQVESRWIW